MAFVAPLAVAAGASAAAATWISVGVSVAFLVGSWLFNASNRQKNEIFDPGAQEMPRFNQALRGATMPVMFGTNRVPSHIVWTKNFRTIRKETDTGGGGKFGGSGFGSKTPSSGEVTYEYKWDLLFHMGMSPEPYSLFGGWVGADRIADSTINAISLGDSNNLQFLGGSEHAANMSLRFDEAFYSPGPRTGDTEFTPWAYFTAQEGHEHWFPNTLYVGFKQLSLGGQPNIPQLTWEVGPGGAQIDITSGYISDGGQDSLFDNLFITSGSSILGDDGKRWVVTNGYVICIDDGTIVDKSENQLEADAESFTYENGNSGGGASINFNAEFFTHHYCAIAGQERYFLVVGHDAGTGSVAGFYFILYKINSSSQMEAVGAYFAGDSAATDIQLDSTVSASITNLQTDDDPIVLLWAAITDERPVLFLIPSINSLLTPMAQTDGNRGDELSILMDPYMGDSFFNNNLGWGGLWDSISGWFLPSASGGTRLYLYVNKLAASNYVSGEPLLLQTYAPTYRNGFIGYFDLGTIAFPADDVSFSFVDTTFHIANDDIEDFPFDDAGFAVDDETVVAANDYWTLPSIVKLTDVAVSDVFVVIFTKRFHDAASKGTNGQYSHAIGYFYNPLTGAYTSLGELGGRSFNKTDLGASGDTYTVHEIFTFYIPEDEKAVVATHTVNTVESAWEDKIIFSEIANMTISGGDDVYPPYIIRQILTSQYFGIGSYTIDEESYNETIDYCELENIKVSTVYHREEGALRIIELLLSLYGGYLVISGGKIKFGRQETTTPVRTIDNHRLVRDGNDPPVKITRGAKQDSANKVKVNYIDRSLEYRQNFVEVEDPVDIDLHGVRAREFPPQFVMSEAMANKLAVRALWSGLYARDQYSFVLGLKDSDLEPGDVVTLVDSFHPELSTGVYCRLTRMKESRPGRYEWIGVTEYAEYNSSSLAINSSTNISSNILFGPALPPLDFRMYELPKEFQGANPQLYVGWVPGNFAMGARLYASADNVSFAQVLDIQPYIIAGRLSTNLGSHDGIDQNVTVHLFPSSGFSASSPTYTMTHALDDVSQAARATGAGLMWVGSEMMAYQGVTLLGQNHYRFDKVYRGWGGTYIHAHSAGDYWWKQGGGVFMQGYNEDKIGTTIYYKVSPYNFAGVEYNISSIDAKSYQIQGTYYRPQNCPAIHTYIDTPATGTRSEDLRGLSTKAVTSGGCTIYFDWSDASRMEGYGQGGYGAGGYGHFATDTTSHSWRVEVSSSNGFVVRSVSVSTTYYEYDRAVNSADFNGWKGEFTVRVTPYNSYGDALISGVKSLNLFG
jgi:hypothetical protein